ncbi:uncharacterized protein LOC111700143 [Eurytemora carolleeae]|uniref:uncharacterized protein LOC111700143 n=1 Tax=Eurytemora carolleeae TaxID=1294199 RepID=UPI000C780891|nr:uncharacterized protein LOC111700143 [Eurytemora carolleeae]|eukprot:XP_023326731.1 uncharacterized protein LOC111700143 [Eurytemora affinis]
MTQECPRLQCEKWLKTKPVFSPRPLETLGLGRLLQLIQSYPKCSIQEKKRMRKSLKNLLSLPSKYTTVLTQEILRSTWSRSAILNSQPIDDFLVKELQSEMVKWLDFDRMGPNFRIQTILNLNRMPNLVKLNLRLAGPKPWAETFTVEQTDRILSNIIHLRELIFQNLADDFFLSKLGLYCKKLLKLDVQGSVNVSDKSLKFIENLKELTSIDFSGTSIEEETFLLFLQKKKCFESIGLFHNFQLLDKETGSVIKQLTIKNSCQTDIHQIVETCSSLIKLELRCVSTRTKLHTLGRLENLTNLYISGSNYRQSNLSVCLMGRAGSLTSLHLEHVSGMDSCDLRTIGQYLLALEDLTIMNCCLSRGLMDRVEERTAEKKQLRLYTSLKSLNISSNISPSQFLLLTGHAGRLRNLQTGLSCWVSTRLLSHLVRLNPLSQLEFLRIDYTSDLCAAALFLVLRTATSLKNIVGTETWQDLDTRICGELNQMFQAHQLPHTLLSFQSQIF